MKNKGHLNHRNHACHGLISWLILITKISKFLFFARNILFVGLNYRGSSEFFKSCVAVIIIITYYNNNCYY